MNPILQAIRYGHSAQSILDYLKNLDPELATKITLALQAGQTAENVVSYLLKAGKKVSSILPDAPKEKEVDYTNLYEVSKKGHPAIPGMIKTGLAVGSALALGPMISRYLQGPQAIMGELLPAQEAIEFQPQKLLPGPQISGQLPPPRPQAFSPFPGGQAPDITGAIQQQAMQRATGMGIPTPTSAISQQAGMAQAAAPAVAQPAVSKAMQIATSASLIPYIAKFAENNKDPKAVTALLYNSFPKEMKQFQKDVGVPMEEAIAEVMQQMPELAQGEQRLPPATDLASSAESLLPSMTSPREMPEGALPQQEPVQASTKPESSAARTIKEPTLEGPITLGSIDPTSNRIIRQAYNNVDEIYQNIESKQPEFKSFLENIKTNIPGISFVKSRLKDKQTLEKKIAQKGSPETISDYMGGRIIFENDEAMKKALAQIGNQYKIIEEDNFIENSRNDGYRAIHLQADLGNGTSAEIQLQPKEVMEVFDEAHDLYDKWKRQENYTREEFNQAFKDKTRAKFLLDDAWNRYQERERKPKVGSPVVTDKGDIGTVDKISGKTAQIKTDTGKAGAQLDDAVKIPEELYKSKVEVSLENIPEYDKSSMLRMAMPLKQGRELLVAFGPKNEYYRYWRKDGAPIPGEYLDDLANPTKKPSTSGLTFLGGWDESLGDSRGSRTHEELSKNSQDYRLKDRKGNPIEDDPSKEYFFEKVDPHYLHPYDKKWNETVVKESEEFKRNLYAQQGKTPRAKKPAAENEPRHEAGAGQPSVRPEEGAQEQVKKKEVAKQLAEEHPEIIPEGENIVEKRVPTKEIGTRPDIMQFKTVQDVETGENPEDKLKGKFDTLKSGVLLLWEPKNPEEYDLKPGEKYIVANGHHRLAFAKREKVPSLLTRIIREKDGYKAADAMRLGAEINIAEGRGTVYDQAKYFRDTLRSLGEAETRSRAEQTGRTGEKAWSIAANAGDDLYKAFINEDIKPEHAYAIAESTKDKDRQALGMKFAREGKSADQIKNLIEASKTVKTKPDSQLDLFGFDNSTFKAIEKMGAAASKIMKDINQKIAAISGASKHPEKAKAYGIDIKDPEGIKKALSSLKSEKERWADWSSDPDLVEVVKNSV